MKVAVRRVVVCLALFFLMSFNPRAHAQDAKTAGSSPGYLRRPPVDMTTVRPFTPGIVLELPRNTKGTASTTRTSSNAPTGNVSTSSGAGGNIAGLNTVPTFDGAFFAQNGPASSGVQLWRFTMMGNDPIVGGTTLIPTNTSEITLQLLNADGSTFKTVPFAPFEDLIEDSPNFRPTGYSSNPSGITQLGDAIQRAEFFNLMNPTWHTWLTDPNVVNRVTLQVPFFVNVRLANGNIIQARSYFTGTAADGSTFVLMLNLLFNLFFDNEVVNEINAGSFTTNAVNMTLFPNTYLFSLNVNNPNVPGGCCVLGFHTYFFAPGAIPQPRWLTLYASWISPGIFGGGFQDVTGLSHELSETFDDPFVDNATPSWQFPGEPANAKVCQSNLETGDPIEVLASATIPITILELGQTIIYHPQNEALLQWFEMGATSNALNGAFSYPDTTVLQQSAQPCPQ